MDYDFRWDLVLANLDVLLYGVQYTFVLSLYALAIGIAGGLVLALLRMRRSRAIDAVVLPIVDILRAVPALVILFWFFYCLPVFTGVDIAPLDSAAIALGLLTAAFLGEIIRGGILSVERGQWEAAAALGMKPRQVYRRVVLPQAVMRMLPPLASTVMSLIKNSALAAALGVTELTWQAGVLVQYNFRPIETFTVVAVIYLAITYPLSLLVTYLQRRFQPRRALA